MQKITRRFFIGGLASAFSLGSRSLFAVAPGSASSGRANLVFGVVSDVHVALAKGGERLRKDYNVLHLERTFASFRDQGAHAVVIAGDIAHNGVLGELKAVADAWYRVFPNDRAPDGRKVERIFVFGNHDWSGLKRGKGVYADEAKVKAEALCTDPRRFWDECFHEEWREMYTREVNGYLFVGAHWCKGSGPFGDCNGQCETPIEGLAERYAALKGKIDPSRPFFHVQHPHPRGTVHGDVWGQDDGASTRVLSAWPNAVAFSGHSHTSLLDDKGIWQGAFTSVGTASLRNVGQGGITCGLEGGYENYHASGKDAARLDALKMMPSLDRLASKQGQLVSVYSDRIVFAHRDFVDDVALEDDLVMPLPAAESKPFAFASRAAAAKPPQFADDAKLAFGLVKAKGRSATKKDKAKSCVEIVIPPALSGARCARYEMVTDGADGKELKIALLADSLRFAAGDRRVQSPIKCRLAVDRLAAGELKFAVTAISTWNKRSAPLTGRFICRQ